MARRHKSADRAPDSRSSSRRSTAHSDFVRARAHATKYTPRGRASPCAREGDDRATVAPVQGRGFPRTSLESFPPYARGLATMSARLRIGLFASRRVVEGQGGDIWVEESPDGGAVFAFTVPLARATADAASR